MRSPDSKARGAPADARRTLLARLARPGLLALGLALGACTHSEPPQGGEQLRAAGEQRGERDRSEPGAKTAALADDLRSRVRVVAVGDSGAGPGPPTDGLVRGLLIFRGGRAAEEADRLGLVDVLAEALHFGGPTALSGQEFHQRLQAAGAELAVRAADEALRIELSAPPAALDEVLAAAAQLVLHPHYPPEVVERARARLLERLEREAVDPGARADAVLAQLAFEPGSPYGRRPRFDTVEALERGDLLAWHRAHLGRDRLWAAAVGPLEPGRFERALATAFAELGEVGPAPPPAAAATPLSATPRLVALTLPGTAGAELRLVAPGVAVTSPDYPPLRLWSDLNGRRAGGGAFFAPRWPPVGGAGEEPRHGELFGFVVDAAEPGPAAAALVDLVEQLRGAFQEPPPPGELEAARARVVAAHARDAAAPLAQLEPALHGAPEDFWARHGRALESATADEVAAAAARALGPAFAPAVSRGSGGAGDGGTAWLAVGVFPSTPPEEALAAVRALGAEVETGDGRLPLRGTPEAAERLATVLEALGGREGWRRLESLTLVGEVHLEGRGDAVAVTLVRDLAGERLRVEHRDSAGGRVQVVTPEAGAQRSGDEAAVRLDEELHARVLERERTLVYRVLRGLAQGTRHAVRLDGPDALVVTLDGQELCTLRLAGDLPVALETPATRLESPRRAELAGWKPAGSAGLLFATEMRDGGDPEDDPRNDPADEPAGDPGEGAETGRRFRWLRVDPELAPAPDAFSLE